VLSTWPSYLGCAISVVDQGAKYCYLQGTSMASPHVAGLAGLIRSQHPGMRASSVQALIQSTADPIACPASYTTPVNYTAFPAVDNGAPQVCTGGAGYNSFNGHGQVNAVSAVK
jgi:subtilisin family serine protease